MLACIMPIATALTVAVWAGSANAATVVTYTDRTDWENALRGPYLIEDFADSQLNAGVTYVSTASGHINPAQQCYQDVLASQSQPEPMTTWSFAPPVAAFGGNWTLGGPGGSGNSLLVYIDDLALYVGTIPNSYGGGFWGFISDTPFTSVKLVGGSGTNQQNYSLDDMVYSVAPLPCPADYNNSGDASVQDIFDFLADYFANSPSADFNLSGAVTVQDIFDFLAAYFAGCS